jgi:hypothetical protein
VASIGLGAAEFKTYVAEVGPGRGRPERPSECLFCDGAHIWFDGWRWVFCLILEDGSVRHFDDGLPLQRVKCASCRTSWTLHPDALYPRRSFEPDVVEHAALAYLADASATYAGVAEEHRCSPRSVWRWVGWLAFVVQARGLLAEAERLSGSGQSAALIPRNVPQDHEKAKSAERAATLLDAYQAACALAVWSRSQPVPPADPSPLRFWLVERFLAFHELHLLTAPRPSPRSPEDATGPPRIDRRA